MPRRGQGPDYTDRGRAVIATGAPKKAPTQGGRNRGIGNSGVVEEFSYLNYRAATLMRRSIWAHRGRCQRLPGKIFTVGRAPAGSETPYSAGMMSCPHSHVVVLSRVAALIAAGWGAAVFGAGPAGGPVAIKGPLPIEVSTSAAIMESRTQADGVETRRLVPATDISEGQVVYYTLTIRNPGSQPAHDVVVTKPVPANTRYIPGSAVAPNATVTFSIDGGVTFAPARNLLDPGEPRSARPVAPERYTHIRWQMRYPLAPGAVAYARFRAVFQ